MIRAIVLAVPVLLGVSAGAGAWLIQKPASATPSVSACTTQFNMANGNEMNVNASNGFVSRAPGC